MNWKPEYTIAIAPTLGALGVSVVLVAAGRDLSVPDNVLIAAAACELHPRAVLKGVESSAVKDELRRATAEALERGLVGVPSVWAGNEMFWGDDRLEDAAAALHG